MNNLAQCQKLIANGDFEIAYNVCMAAIEADQNDHTAWWLLGQLSRRMQYQAEAVDFFSKAVELAPRNSDYLTDLIAELHRAGLVDDARSLLRERYQLLDRVQFEHLLTILKISTSDDWLVSLAKAFYLNCSGKRLSGPLRLVSLADSGNSSIEVLDESKSWPVSPLALHDFFNVNYDKVFSQYSYSQYQAVFSEVLLISGLDAILDEANGLLIADELANHVADLDKQHFYSKNLSFINDQVLGLASDHDCVVVEHAISFFGSCNANYAHWLFEKLPRFYWIEQLELPENTYVLIESGLPDSVMTSLEAFWPKGRILRVEPGRMIRVQRLFHLSNTLEFFEPREAYPFAGNEFRICPQAFPWLGRQLKKRLAGMDVTTELPGRFWYLPRRPGALRSIMNDSEVRDALGRIGLGILDPGGLSFFDQVEVFSRARMVVGASGAAFANLLFMPAGSVAIIVCHDTPQMPMWFFHAVAQAVGVHLMFFSARAIEDSHPLEMHRVVTVDPAALAAFVKPYLPEESAYVQEIGFLLHHEELLNHYIPVWDAMNDRACVGVLAGEASERGRIAARLQARGMVCRTVEEIIDSEEKLSVLVSNHPLEPAGEVPLIKRLARTNVRFMYAAGKGGWNFAEWNELYDLILTMGPTQHQALSHFRNPVILPMGWPRMDAYFSQTWDRAALYARYHCDPQRKTIVWLPTWTEVSSVALYADTLAKLTHDYNVVVKLHPLHGEQAPDDLARLQAAGFNCLLTGSEDNVPLLQLADWVFADYGGSPFAAIYAGKPLLLLDVPLAATHFTMGVDSPDLLLRESLLSISPDDQDQIADLLLDSTLWQTQMTLAVQVLAQHIYPFRGCAAALAASYLANLNTVLR